MRLRLPGSVAGAAAQSLIDSIRLHDFARIHFAIRIPNRFELAECLYDLGPEHLVQKLRLRLAVAMFAGERSAVTNDQIGRVLHERTPLGDSRRGREVPIDAA